MLFSKAVIAGVGLMGGSLGLAMKKQGLAREVVGLVRRVKTIREAKARGCIDSGTLSVPRAVRDADLVILAGPVSSTLPLLKAMLPHLHAGCLVTDLGSTKVKLLGHIAGLLPPKPGFDFISSHPMAGSEKAGVLAARQDLYLGSLCMLIKTSGVNMAALAPLKALWRSVGCRKIKVVTPQEHDRWTAAVSHLPHAVAVGLVNLIVDLAARDTGLMEIASTGFLDTTRIAGGLPAMWQDILLNNREEICTVLVRFKKKLSRLEGFLRNREETSLRQELERAYAFRQGMEGKKNGRKKG